MKALSRFVCCAVLIGALVPASALAAPKSAERRVTKYSDKGTAITSAARTLAVVADTYEPDDDGPGQTITSANMPLNQNRAIGTDDIDIYTLTGTPGTKYTFEAVADIDTDTIIYVYDYDTGEVLGWFDDRSDVDYSAAGSWTASTGCKKVIIEVSAYGTGPYTMNMTATSRSVRAAKVARIEGANRFAVAVNTAKAIYGTTWKKSTGAQVSDVIVVCGEDRAMADPLAAASLAGWYEAPLLMTNTATLSGDTAAAIKSVRTANGGKVTIRVIGGTGSVSPAVYSKLNALKGTGKIERIQAANRYDLAAVIADRLDTLMFAAYGEHPSEVYVANGQNPLAFYDALAASGMCYAGNVPLLLTQNTAVPASTKSRIKGKFSSSYVVAVNGTKYMPKNVYDGVLAEERMVFGTGADRYVAALDIAQWGFWSYYGSQSQLIVVNKLPDALGAGTFAGAKGGVMLYTPLAGPSGATASFLTDRKSMVDVATVFGGTGSVTAAGKTKVSTLLNTP